MFRLRNKDAKFPELYPKVVRKKPTVNDKGWTKIGDFTLRPKIDFAPQEGLQEKLCASEENLVFLCGDSQIGKTYGMDLNFLKGLGKIGYTARMISVRLQDSKKGGSIFRDAVEVCGNFAGCEYNSSDYPTFLWKQWNAALQLIHSNYNVDNPSEWEEFKDYAKKNQASLIQVDEATEMKAFKMFTYWFSRNRDSSGMTPQMVLSFNFEHEHWTTQFLVQGGYIGEDWYFKPEMNGVRRYFYIAGDDVDSVIWGDTPEEVAEVANIHISQKEREAGVTIHQIVKSFLALTGETADNLELIAATKGQNIGNLHATGATQRAILRGGYAGPVEKEEVKVSRRMINDMFEGAWNGDENMYATLDVSGGNTESDNCPLCIFKGNMWIAVKFFRGSPKELVSWIDTQLKEYNVPIQNFAFDATGIGYYLKSYTNGIPITANRKPIQEVDEYGNQVTLEQCFNVRSQFLNKMKVLLEKGEMACSLDKNMVIPYGKNGQTRRLIDVLYDEANVFTFTTKNNKIYARSKDEYKAKFKSSPDLIDSLVLVSNFFLDARPKKQPAPQVPDDAYNGLYRSYSGRERAVWI